MKLILIGLINIASIHVLTAQGPVVFSRITNSSVTQNDSTVVVSTLGQPFDGLTSQNEIVVTTEPLPFLLISEITSVKDLLPIEGLNVFPNPTSENAVLQRNSSDDKLFVRLYRTDGMRLFENVWPSGENSIEFPLANYASGVYLLSVTDEKETLGSVWKIVKH